MKTTHKNLLLVSIILLLCTLSFGVLAEDDVLGVSGSCGINATFFADAETGILTISGTGSVTTLPSFTPTKPITEVVIEEGITAIDSAIFSNLLPFTFTPTKLSIPSTVTSIAPRAFQYCSTLTEIIVDDANTTFSAEDCVIFNKDKTTLHQYVDLANRTSYAVPAHVTSVKANAFSMCEILLSLSVDEENASLSTEEFIFFNKDKTKLVAYNDRSSRTTYTTPQSVIVIGSSSFADSENLVNITITTSETVVFPYAFKNCYLLESITLPKKVSIHRSAFLGCPLTDIYYMGTQREWEELSIWDKLCDYDLSLSYVKISFLEVEGTCGDNLTWRLTSEGILKISGNGEMFNYSFGKAPWHNLQFSTVIIDDGVTSIGNYAFYNCLALETITLPTSISSVDNSSFYGCTSLTDVYFLGDEFTWHSLPFTNSIIRSANTTFAVVDNYIAQGSCGKNLGWALDKDGTLTIKGSGKMDDWIFVNESAPWSDYSAQILNIKIEEGVTNIGAKAFPKCSSLTSVFLPASLTTIGNDAFSNCENLNKINFPEGLTSIDQSAFNYCHSLTDITLPQTINSIGYNAFRYCSGLTEIHLPDSPILINNYAFTLCSGLTEISIPSGSSIGVGAFLDCSNLSKVFIPDDIVFIGGGAFSGCVNLSDFQLSENNQKYSLQDNVIFSKDKKTLSCFLPIAENNYTIPDNVTSIEPYAFLESDLVFVTIPESISVIPFAAFARCYKLTRVNVHDKITSIENSAFQYCIKLSTFVLPNAITIIESGVFSGCSSLRDITIPISVKTIENNAFSGCNKLTVITYNGEEENWNTIDIGNQSSPFLSATVLYRSSTTPFVILSPHYSTVLSIEVFLPIGLEEKDGILLFGVYKGEKPICFTSNWKVIYNSRKWGTLIFFDEALNPGEYSVKVFYWSDFNSISPLCAPAETTFSL